MLARVALATNGVAEVLKGFRIGEEVRRHNVVDHVARIHQQQLVVALDAFDLRPLHQGSGVLDFPEHTVVFKRDGHLACERRIVAVQRLGAVGQELDSSEWLEITQDRINQFAEATMDHQWIHVDPERAKQGPFGGPIAHGQLTMSVMSFLPGGEGVGLPQLDGMKMGVNLGWNKVRFMNPVPVMQLVELIRGIATDEDTFQTCQAVVEKLGKTAASAEDFPAFIVNRILMPMINEAVYTLYEGVGSVRSIDESMKLGANHPMGPLELADFIGLDTCLAIMNVLHDGLADTKYRPCPLLTKYVEAGWLGRKTQRGFYDYRGEMPVPTR